MFARRPVPGSSPASGRRRVRRAFCRTGAHRKTNMFHVKHFRRPPRFSRPSFAGNARPGVECIWAVIRNMRCLMEIGNI
ncbi:MAG: hypothetical protein BAA02_12695 [Paenibacillaceae bacterium ZCTH02-B3]|nr:MAG: hypothetical protein BAA02_12695 [Paenibacillaceae bacterium ZCTH02-B3]